jgi:uncharacterized protein (AIM24 family)
VSKAVRRPLPAPASEVVAVDAVVEVVEVAVEVDVVDAVEEVFVEVDTAVVGGSEPPHPKRASEATAIAAETRARRRGLGKGADETTSGPAGAPPTIAAAYTLAATSIDGGPRSDRRHQMAVEQELARFKETETGEPFTLQNAKLLKVELANVSIDAKLGSMVAYQGDVRFEHAGSGGVSRMIKKAVTNEGTTMMKVSGTGEVFLAHLAQDIQLLRLEDDRITANGANLLAFEDGIDWDIKRVEGVSGAMSGGLYNVELAGTGSVALVSDGPPVLIEIDGSETYADPQAAITWSSGLTASVKTDVNLKTFIGRGSGETIQMAFSGAGWLLVQPSEGRVAGGGGAAASGGAGGALGKILGG